MNVAVFCHSIVSDWNHGNAHFLRGVTRELIARGHAVRIFEPRDGWSRRNLTRIYGREPLDEFRRAFPELTSTLYDLETLDVDEAIDGSQLVLVHEWNDPRLAGRRRALALAFVSTPLPRHAPPFGDEAARDGAVRPAPLRRRPRLRRGPPRDLRPTGVGSAGVDVARGS